MIFLEMGMKMIMIKSMTILPRLVVIIVLMLVLVWLTGIYPLARFNREFIDIEIHPNRVLMNGLYVYRNPFPFPIVQGLSIPLPADARHPMPIALEVDLMSSAPRKIPVRYLWGRHRMDLRIPACGEGTIRVRYEQYAPDCDARYILTSTGAWKRPLRWGVYRLILKGVRLENSNYVVEPDGTGALRFERMHFQPKTDWLFAWRPL